MITGAREKISKDEVSSVLEMITKHIASNTVKHEVRFELVINTDETYNIYYFIR